MLYNNENIIERFKTEIKENFDMDLKKIDEEIITERLKNHRDCVAKGEVVIAFYGRGDEVFNVAIECENCNEVIYDSDVVEYDEEQR